MLGNMGSGSGTSSTICLLSCTGSGRKVDSSWMTCGSGYWTSSAFANGAFANGAFANGAFANGAFANGASANGASANGAFAKGGVCHTGLAHVCSSGGRGVVLAYMSKNFIKDFLAVFKTHGFFTDYFAENKYFFWIFFLMSKRNETK